MARSVKTPHDTQYVIQRDHSRFALLLPLVVLALWRVRQSWLLLFTTGFGMVVSVMLVCAVPLFSQVALTTGVRSVLQATPESPLLTLRTTATQITPTTVQAIEQQLVPSVQHHLRTYLSGAPDFSLQVPNLDIVSPNLQPNGSYNSILLYGASIARAATHLTLFAGRLPQDSSTKLDIAVTSATASKLGIGIDSTITLGLNLTTTIPQAGAVRFTLLTAHVVGLFTPAAQNDPFWHGTNFTVAQNGSFLSFQALVSNQALVHALAILQNPTLQLLDAPMLVWSYHLDPLRISSMNLNALIDSIATLQTQLSSRRIVGSSQPNLSGLAVSNINNSDSLSSLVRYQERVGIVQIAVLLISLQLLLLVLFFLVITMDLLVSRQAEAIALMRSRGASRGQIIGITVTQNIGQAVVVLMVGPLLSLSMVRVVMQQVLSSQEQSALNTLSLQALWDVRGYALTATVVTMLAMLSAVYRASSRNIIVQRRELARSTKRPLFQRLHFDVVVTIVGLTCYIISQYIVNGQISDTRTTTLLAVPLVLIAPLFLGIALLLFSIRFLPSLLRRLSQLAGRARGSAHVLAFAQMARAPQQIIPRTLLLTLTTVFAIFAVVFITSQTQHTFDVAAYQTGADFSGSLVQRTVPSRSTSQIIAAYSHIAGVNTVAVGEQEEALTTNMSQVLTVELEAVDTRSITRTVNWQQWNSGIALPKLMQRLMLTQQRDQPLPALTDATLWETLHLAQGSTFALQTARGNISFIAMGELSSIPQKAGTTSGTVIVNYSNYANYTQSHVTLNATTPPINYVWLRTSQDAVHIQQVRTALSHGPLQLAPLNDRLAIAHTLQTDPLYLDLAGILTIGTITSLLLSFLANWLACWVSVQERQTTFVALRALGTTPKQIAYILAWEQGSMYALAILLGLLFGFLLAEMVVPTLIFTSVSGSQISSTHVYITQNAIPTQLVFSPLLLLVVLALILSCIVVMFMMIRLVLQLSLSQILRLNMD